MEDRKTILIAGLMKTYSADTMNQIPLLWQELSPHFGKLPGQVGRKAYGVVYNLKNSAGFAYLAGVEVSNASDVPDEFNVVRLPEMVYAVFPHAGHVSTLKDTISAIWNEWLPASGLKTSHADDEMPDMLEQYGEAFDPAVGTGDIELWVPIKNRARMITVEPTPGA
jgi:AraC family transcriptional regulator